MKRIYVLAMNYREFRNFLDTEADPKHTYVYVSAVHTVRGAKLTEDTVTILPGAYLHRDAQAIQEVVQLRLAAGG